MWGRGGSGFVFWARCRGCEWQEDWVFVNIYVVFGQLPQTRGLEASGGCSKV